MMPSSSPSILLFTSAEYFEIPASSGLAGRVPHIWSTSRTPAGIVSREIHAIPEISMMGKTEDELTKKRIPNGL